MRLKKRDARGQVDETANLAMSELVSEIRSLREEVSGLKAELQEMRRIENKSGSPGNDAWWRFWRRNR